MTWSRQEYFDDRSDFKFVADRLIRMVIEEGLNQLPYQDCEVITPTGCSYSGLKYEKGNCGVSIVRSGEAMEKALQECCRSMRIGKVLVDSDSETHEAHVVFAKFPDDISSRKVLLLYPIMRYIYWHYWHKIAHFLSFRSGNKVCKAVQVLKEHNVPEEHIILINLFCTPDARNRIVQQYPDVNISFKLSEIFFIVTLQMTVLTTELHPVTPNHFGQRYFGTDYVD